MKPERGVPGRRVKIADLRDHLSRFLRAVEAGEEIEVLDRERPIARIVPVAQPSPLVSLVPPARPFAEVRGLRFKPARWPSGSLTLLAQERRERLGLLEPRGR